MNADGSGGCERAFLSPLIDGIVAVSGAGGVAVESRDAVNHGLFHFLLGFPQRRAGPISFPDSRVERGDVSADHTDVFDCAVAGLTDRQI